MTYTVSITSQGQISIPAKIRRRFGYEKTRRAIIEAQEDGTLVIRPVVDLLDLFGSIKTKKKISSKEIRRGFEEYLANRSR